jgi:hypothetical protein
MFCMDFTDARQLIHLRHELRRLLVERRTVEAQAVLARLEALVASDAEEAGALRPELARWRTSLELVGSAAAPSP